MTITSIACCIALDGRLKYTSQFLCGYVMCQNVLMVWHSTTELFECLIRRNLRYPCRDRDTAGQKKYRLIFTVHLAFFERTERTSKFRSLKTAFCLRHNCIFALIGGFTACTVACLLLFGSNSAN